MAKFKDLEVYNEEEEELKQVKKSNTSKFFEGIKKVFVKSKTKEDDELEKIKQEARIEALQELKPQLKEEFKKQELARLTKPKKNVMQKIGEEILGGGKSLGGLANDEKLKRMLSNTTGNNLGNNTEKTSYTKIFNEEKILGVIGSKTNVKPTTPTVGPSDDKILEMLGGKKKNDRKY